MQDQTENASKLKVEPKFTTLDDIDDLRKNVGFHFTPIQNLESILENGLTPRIGENASGALGQSAIPKTYVSYGLEGVMQLYNRLLNLSLEGKIKNFQSSSHKPFLPNNVQDKDLDSKLSLLEGFEFIRLYMENNTYLVFDAPMSEYEHTVEDSELDEINSKIKTFTDENGVNISEKIDKLNEEIERLSDDKSADKEEIKKYVTERDKLAIDVYRRTLDIIKEKQGKLLNGNKEIVIDKIDFNDEKLRWTNFEKNPHNTHTRIEENEKGQLLGIPIKAQELHQFSSDGTTRGNGLQFLGKMITLIKDGDKLNLQATNCVDVNLIKQFYEYVKIIEQYKMEHPELITEKPSQTVEFDGGKKVTYPAMDTIDLNDISKYPELEEFEHRTSIYYQEERKKVRELKKALNTEKSEISVEYSAETSSSTTSQANIRDVIRNGIKSGIATEDVKQAEEVENELEKTNEEVSKDD